MRYLEPEEAQHLLRHAEPYLKPILVVALHAGMRRGGILNLKWRDVDFKNRVVTVVESKSGEGRHIPMSAGGTKGDTSNIPYFRRSS